MSKPEYLSEDLKREAEAAADLVGYLKLVDEADEDLVNDSIEGETDFLEAIDRALREIAEAEMMVDAISERIKKLTERKGRYALKASGIKGVLQVAMKVANGDRALPFTLQTPESTVTLRSVNPKVIVTDEASVPSIFWAAQPPKLDKKALNEFVSNLGEDDELPEGVALSEPGFTLAVRKG